METDTRGMLDQWPFQPVHSPFAFAPCGFTSARFALPITKPLFLPGLHRRRETLFLPVQARLGLAHSQSLSVGVGWCPAVVRSRSRSVWGRKWELGGAMQPRHTIFPSCFLPLSALGGDLSALVVSSVGRVRGRHRLPWIRVPPPP